MAVVIASDIGKDIAGEPLLRGVSFKLERRDRMTLSGPQRRRQDDAAADARRRGVDRPRRAGASRRARRSRCTTSARRANATSRCATTSSPARSEIVARRGRSWRGLEQAMADGAHDEATLDAYARAQARLEHTAATAGATARSAMLHGLGFGDERPRPRAVDLLRRRADARLARPRARRRRPTCCCSTSRRTTSTSPRSSGWSSYLVELDAAVVLVAHDRWFLEAVGTAVLELEAGRSRFFAGPWHAWRQEQAARELALGRAIDKQQAEIARLERFVERFRAKATKARQAQSRVKRLDKIERIERDPRDVDVAVVPFKAPERAGRVIFELEDGRVEVPGRTLLDDAELWLERGEHVALVGANGSGKTTLIETLAGNRPLAGRQAAHGPQRAGRLPLPARRATSARRGTVLEAAQRATRLTPNKARALLGRFLFSGEEAREADRGPLRRRAPAAVARDPRALGRERADPRRADEPPRRREPRGARGRAARASPARCCSSRTIARCSTRSARARSRSRTARCAATRAAGPTTCAMREERRALQDAAAADGGGAAKAAARRKAPPAAEAEAREPARSKNAVREAQQLEREIEAAEAALQALEEELADPAAWTDPERAAASTERHEAAKRAVEELYARYERVAGVTARARLPLA